MYEVALNPTSAPRQRHLVPIAAESSPVIHHLGLKPYIWSAFPILFFRSLIKVQPLQVISGI